MVLVFNKKYNFIDFGSLSFPVAEVLVLTCRYKWVKI